MERRELRQNLHPKKKPPKMGLAKWAIPIAIVCAIVFGASMVIAGLTLHRNINVTISGESMTVSPASDVGMNLTKGETKTQDYVVTNVSSSPYNVRIVQSVPADYTVTYRGNTVGVITPGVAWPLAAGASEVVTVTVVASPTATSGTIGLDFVNDLG